MLRPPFMSCSVMMGSKHFLKEANPRAIFATPLILRRFLHSSLLHLNHQDFGFGRVSVNQRKPALSVHRLSKKRITTISFARPVRLYVRDEAADGKEKLMALKHKLESEGIPFDECKLGEYSRLLCPKCLGGSTSSRSFSVFIRKDGTMASWACFRADCGWSGSVQASTGGVRQHELGKSDETSSKGDEKRVAEESSKPSKDDEKEVAEVSSKRILTEESLSLEPPGDEVLSYFAERMISRETLRRNGVMQTRRNTEITIAFPYRRDGEIVNCKYRGPNKKFYQEKHPEKILYGLEDIRSAKDIIIVEGEMDKLSMEEAGYLNCVSVPDGAPPQVSRKEVPPMEQDKKYAFLWNCKEYFDNASRIILATDADKPGQALAEEIARRVGKERCWRVKWPKRNVDDVYKDANEVLMYLGKDALKEVIEKAELYPVQGLFKFEDYFNEIDAYYNSLSGIEMGVSTGWDSVDKLYKVVPGEVTIVTGVPSSGKSEWIDALLCNINRKVGWRFALCSMENKVKEHGRKLLEKHIRKPFFNAWYAESRPQMSQEELEQGKKWLNDTFYLIRSENDCLPSVKWVLHLAKIAVFRHGVRGIVIDPYNELDHQWARTNMKETEYVSSILTMIKRFAQHHACHVWFVAHPRQQQNWEGGAPNIYDISGSAHFINKCDNAIVVHRNRDLKVGPLDQVQVAVRKVRNKVVGTIGDAFLSYDRVTGEYFDIVPSDCTHSIRLYR